MTAPTFPAWPDADLHRGMLHSIHKSSMNHTAWRYTRLDTIHDELREIITLEQGEMPIVSSYIDSDRWYLLTSRYVWSGLAGYMTKTPGPNIAHSASGNFKGFGQQETERMVLQLHDGAEVHFDFETGFASMAPIYYTRYWTLKFPALFKGLKFP
ncbi:hypothetical protein MF271_22440 (plasmid) [Deinococcus sp. KNUC1210]|uniref:hypothetical protein n=1 Tax=Deinococcus sp. KNUC1210 TaxID=2917691 RepID=UPI001EF12859|nr:hypothetical protein [Deinococcus sp. KNUC1210]ULH18375.1 hypothetical protein MF271_22440 [Deinococcus sp. KNUC1210]